MVKFKLIELPDGKFQAEAKAEKKHAMGRATTAVEALGEAVLMLSLFGGVKVEVDRTRARPKMFAEGTSAIN